MNMILKKMREQEQQRNKMQGQKSIKQVPADPITKLRQRIKDLYSRLYQLMANERQTK